MTKLKDNDQIFLELIQKNLQTSGYPQKSVQFSLEKMYELADNKGANLNTILDHLKNMGMKVESTTDKILFHKPNFNDDTMAKAQEMMKNMSPEQLAEIQNQVENMTPEQRAQMMEQAKKMGLF
jgi:hypothetical protein